MAEPLTLEHFISAEADVLKLSGLPLDLIERKDVEVGEFREEKITVRTLVVGGNGKDQEEKPIMVLVHGYGA